MTGVFGRIDKDRVWQLLGSFGTNANAYDFAIAQLKNWRSYIGKERGQMMVRDFTLTEDIPLSYPADEPVSFKELVEQEDVD